MRRRISMPRWPGWVMFGTALACIYPAATSSAPIRDETYQAAGGAPGWTLSIHDARMNFDGGSGPRLTVVRPEPQEGPGGRRYETSQLVVEIVHARCNLAATGLGYEHRVSVTADGRTVEGCGGARRAEWDA